MSTNTIRDVAKEAGVGVGTVSRVLNNHPSVREVTRQRVEEAIANLDYSPNPIARQLSLGRTSNIAVVAPFFIRPASVERLRGIETVLAERDYDLVLYNVEYQHRREQIFRTLPRGDLFDGLIILTLVPDDREAAVLTQSRIPVVLIDAKHPAINHVIIDDVLGGYMATRHLLELGHEKIAYISDVLESPFQFEGASVRRYQGYRKAMHEAGVAFEPAYYRQNNHGVREAQVMAHALLSLEQPPTAMFAASDTQALGILRAAEERGIEVPKQLSVIGFDDIEVAEYMRLTTIHQPLFRSGVEGAALLLDIVESDAGSTKESKEIKLPLHLVRRQTTAPPPS